MISPDFDQNNISEYHLSIEISDLLFRFNIKKPSENEILVQEEHDIIVQNNADYLIEELQKIYQSHDFLGSKRWKKIDITFDNQSFTLVPNKLFQKEYATRYLQLAKGYAIDSGEEEVIETVHKDLELVNIFSADKKLFDWLSEVYPFMNVYYWHSTSKLINYGIENSKAQTAFIHLEKETFIMVITMGGNLKFCNRFSYQTSQDLLYFIIFVLNEQNIKTDEIFLRISGKIQQDSEHYELISKYLPNVSI
jgi:Protein of unknown function (DUF3822)